jgi:hypothetical protein
MRCGPGNARIQITHELCIRHLGDDFSIERWDVAELRWITLARIELRRQGEIAQLGKAATHVLDVLVYAEDLLYHQRDRLQRPPGRHGPIRRQGAFALGDLHLAGDEALTIGLHERVRLHRNDGGGKPVGPGGPGKFLVQRFVRYLRPRRDVGVFVDGWHGQILAGRATIAGWPHE